MPSNSRPIHVVRGPNGLRLPIWINSGEYGLYYAYTLERSYQVSPGEFKSTKSFRAKDADHLKSLIEDGRRWMNESRHLLQIGNAINSNERVEPQLVPEVESSLKYEDVETDNEDSDIVETGDTVSEQASHVLDELEDKFDLTEDEEN